MFFPIQFNTFLYFSITRSDPNITPIQHLVIKHITALVLTMDLEITFYTDVGIIIMFYYI